MDKKEKTFFLLNRFGGIGTAEISELLGITPREAKEYLYSLEKKTHPKENGEAFMDYIAL